MNIFLDAHLLVLKMFLDKKVDFILIGGYAVNFYGYNRATGDLDLWIQPDNNNKLLLITALKELGFDEEGLSIINTWDFTQPQVFHIWENPFKTDFLTRITGVKYEEAKKNAIFADIDNLTIPFIHLNDLIKSKTYTNRLKDKVDVEYLEKILVLRNKQP